MLKSTLEAQSSTATIIRPSNAWTLEELVKTLSQHPMRKAHFEETYFSQLLSSPIKKTGILKFTAPSTFEKHTEFPSQESITVEGDTFLYENKSQGFKKTLVLQDYPPLLTLIEGLRSIFAGDIDTLNQIFAHELKGSRDQWILILTPLDEGNKGTVGSIQFIGQGSQVNGIEIRESSGDYSSLRLTPERK